MNKAVFDKLLKRTVQSAQAQLNQGLYDLMQKKTHGQVHGKKGELGAEELDLIDSMLLEFDTDGDGSFSREEVTSIVANLINMQERVADLKKVAAAGAANFDFYLGLSSSFRVFLWQKCDGRSQSSRVVLTDMTGLVH